MKRRVQFVQGNYYHVYNRGANRDKIFREDENYLFLLKRLGKFALKFNISVIAYCLIPNHYHFLLRQNSEKSINDFMQRTFNSYTKAFNRKYRRTGTLFEGPFKATHVDEENYLVYLCRYIHRNPLEAGLVSNLGDWPYSNYSEWVGIRGGALIDREFVKVYFQRPEEYIEFIQ